MKQILSAALCAALLLSLFLLPVQAAGDPSAVRKVAAEMGVAPADQTDPGRPVTRGEFAGMLVAASPLKGTVSPAGNASPYKDVPYTHASAGFIKTVVQKGWMTGYLDGSFRPDEPVTAAAGTAAVLALLDYKSGDISGSYPEGQMALSQSLGLSEGVPAQAADALTWNDCANLFYNLLSARTKGGEKRYAEVLGYQLDKDGKPDIDAILHTATEGPVVVPAGGWKNVLPFSPAAVYRNNAPADAGALQPWDVLYYSKGKQTVWAYARRISGTLEKVSPGRESPETVTVAGREYKVSGDTAKGQLGASGGLSTGAVVTLLLGRDGEAAAAYAAEDLRTEIIGVVTASGTASFIGANGAGFEAPTLTLMGLDGQTYTVQAAQKRGVGALVRVSFTAEGTKVSNLPQNRAVDGTVSAKESKIGQTPAAEDIQILDLSGGSAVKLYLSRLDGVTLTRDNVLYSEKSPAGVLTTLILKGVTGDQHGYGIVLSVQEKSGETGLSGTYRVFLGGAETTYSLSDRQLGINPGPARIVLTKEGQLKTIEALTELKDVDGVTGMTIKGGGQTHTIWDKAAALIYEDHQYRQVDRNELDPAIYSIKAYFDAPDSQGGRVRLLIATRK